MRLVRLASIDLQLRCSLFFSGQKANDACLSEGERAKSTTTLLCSKTCSASIFQLGVRFFACI